MKTFNEKLTIEQATELSTPEQFQSRLIELQNESKTLLLISSKRVKATREKIQEINKEFFYIKQQWREMFPVNL